MPPVCSLKVNIGVLIYIFIWSTPLITGFNHYNLVADRQLLDDLREFYTTVVGLAPGPRPPFERFGYWLYVAQQDVLHLTEALPSENRRQGRGSTFDHVAFSCTDFASVTAQLKAHGIEHYINDVPLTGQRQIFFRDPAGNGIELNFQMNPAAAD